MKTPWFRECGWIYLPTSWPGWVAVILMLLFDVQVFLAVDRHSHSASDTLYGIFPYVVPSFGILLWVASRTSHKRP